MSTPFVFNPYEELADREASMSVRSFVLALGAGIAAFLIVGVGVTEFAQTWIEFSLFVGIPAGLAAGAFTAAAVYLGLADDAPPRRRRIAGSFAAFGAGFLVALLLLSWVLNLGVTIGIVISVVVALVLAVVAYLRGPRGADPETSGDTHRGTN